MLRRHRLEKFARVVDDEPAGQPPDLRLEFRQLAPVELDVGVPAERVHARHQAIHDVEAERAAVERHDAQPADAASGEALELGVRNAGLDHCYAFRAFSAFRYGIQSDRSEEHTSELQSQSNLVCRLLLEKKNTPID